MELLLLRHGIAADPHVAGCTDAERPLTEEGIEKMRSAAAGMTRVVDRIDIILSSPLRRARETAEIVSEKFKKAGAIVECDELALGGSAKRLLEQLRDYSERERVLLSGHEPELVELISVLTGARSSAVEIKRGALICVGLIEIGPSPRGVLRWQLTSKQLRALAK